MNAMLQLPALVRCALHLALANVFMTFARYAHLRDLGGKPRIVAAVFFMFRS
jgi:uncharacterized protein (DUF486 family)